MPHAKTPNSNVSKTRKTGKKLFNPQRLSWESFALDQVTKCFTDNNYFGIFMANRNINIFAPCWAENDVIFSRNVFKLL